MRFRTWCVLAAALLTAVGLSIPATATAGVSFDVSVTITDGATSVVAGETTTYTVTISNAGPSTASGNATPSFDGTVGAWTCVAAGGGICSANGSGPVNDPFDLPDDASVTYTVPVTIDADEDSASVVGSIVVSLIGDLDEANDTATDEDTVTYEGDLSITKTDGVTELSPGQEVTYTIDAANAGPSEVDATIVDDLPATLTDISWTCTPGGGASCGATDGIGDLNVAGSTLPPGGSLQLLVTAAVDQTAVGAISNTATIASDGSATDPNPANNSATDTDSNVPQADVSITKTDGVTTVKQGAEVTYTIVATNAGPANTTATVTDTPPAALSDVTWACEGSGGATCGSPNGTVEVADGATLPVGGAVTYTLVGTLADDATGQLTNTATIAPALSDPDVGDNAAVDEDQIAETVSDLVLAKDLVGDLEADEEATYTLSVTNEGPDTAEGPIVVTDDLPEGLSYVSATGTGWDCEHTDGLVTCTHAGDLAPDATTTITLLAEVTATGGMAIVNTAAVLGETIEADELNNDDSAGATVAAASAGGNIPLTGYPIVDLLRLAAALVGIGIVAKAARTLAHRAR